MSAWDWIRIAAGLLFFAMAYQEHRRRPDRKIWILGAIVGIGLILAGVFHI
jgi:hypothetical membrane protein